MIACISRGKYVQAQGTFLRWDGERIVIDVCSKELIGFPITPVDRLPARATGST